MKTVPKKEDRDPVIPRVKGQGQKSPEESHKLITKQLVLLLHSSACLKKVAGSPPCGVPNCEMMQGVWGHIKGCKEGPSCPALHCCSSLKILAHWKGCIDSNCSVCTIVRAKGVQQAKLQAQKAQAQQEQQQQQEAQQAQLQLQYQGPILEHINGMEQFHHHQQQLQFYQPAIYEYNNWQQQHQQQQQFYHPAPCGCGGCVHGGNYTLAPPPGSIMEEQDNSAMILRLHFQQQQHQAVEFSMSSSSSQSLSPPSASDVRYAYEQLGIKVDEDALKRLMATLPGGGGCGADDQDARAHSCHESDAESSSRGSGEDDEGVTTTTTSSSPFWYSSLISRLLIGGQRAVSSS